MLFKTRFFKRSKQFLPQTIETSCCKTVKKKQKSTSKDKPVQVLKFSRVFGGKQSTICSSSGQQNVPSSIISSTDSVVVTKYPPCALSQVKMACSDWHHPSLISNGMTRVTGTQRHRGEGEGLRHGLTPSPRKGRIVPRTLGMNKNYSGHPAFQSSLYIGSQKSSIQDKSRRFGRLDIMSAQTLQCILETEDEDQHAM